jgi:hypothetical protein
MIKKTLYLFITLLVIGTTLKAQSADEKAVAEGVKLLNKGLITRDKKLLENIAAPELSYGHSTGDIQNKAEFVDAVMRGAPIYRDIIVTNQTIKIAGDNAIVRHMQVTKLTKSGVKSEIHIGNLLVWHKYNGQWKLIVKQGYKLQ